MANTTMILIGISFILFALCAVIFYKKPLMGFLTIIFLLPFERIGSYSLNPAADHPTVRLVQIAGAAFILTFGLRTLFGKENIRKVIGMRYLIFFAISVLLSAILINYFRVWQIYTWLIFVMALFFLAAQLMTKENLQKIQKPLFVSAGLTAVFGIYQYLGDIAGLPLNWTGLKLMYSTAGTGYGFPRIQSTSIEPLYYANYLMLPIFVGLGVLITKKEKMNYKNWLVLILFGINFVLTISRGAYLAATVAGFVMILLLWRELLNWLRINVKFLLITLVSILVVSLGFLEYASYKTYKNFTSGPLIFKQAILSKAVFATPSFTDRAEARRQGLEVFKSNPIFGVGLGGYAPKVLNYPEARDDISWIIVNNQAIEILAETGIVGFALYVIFLLSLIYMGYKRFRNETDPILRGWLVGLISAVIAIEVQYQTFSGFFITHIWISYALLAGLASREKPMMFSFRKIRAII